MKKTHFKKLTASINQAQEIAKPHAINKLCDTCIEKCKQKKYVKIYNCPEYRSK